MDIKPDISEGHPLGEGREEGNLRDRLEDSFGCPSPLPRHEAFFTPLTWICFIGTVSMLLPESAFSKGLYTFCMNGGMIVWFARMIFFRKPEVKKL